MKEAPQGPGKARSMIRRWRGCILVVALIGLFYAEEDWRGWHAWRHFQKEWEAKGERFDRQSVVPPPVPDDQNFALTPLVRTSYGQMLTEDGNEIPVEKRDTNYVVRMQMNIAADERSLDWRTNGTGDWKKAETINLSAWQNYYRTLATVTNLYPTSRQPQTAAQDVLLALSKYNPTIEELRDAAKLPYSRFPLEYEKDRPSEILLPHLAYLKSCTQVLQLRSLAELQNSQSEEALADVKLMLRMADLIKTEPFLISHLVRISIVNAALQPVYEGLRNNRWSDSQLLELEAVLAGFDFLMDCKIALRGEMVLLVDGNINYLRQHPEYLSTLGKGDAVPSLAAKIGCHLIPDGFFYQNELHFARPLLRDCFPAVDTQLGIVSPDLVGLAYRKITAETRHFTPYNIFESVLFPAYSGAFKRFAQAQADLNLARTAIALERFRLVHSQYPTALESLAPQYFVHVPHDVIGGQSLKYHLDDTGQFLLYSVGWNEMDDGGVVVLRKGSTPSVDSSQGDWVWTYREKKSN